MENLMYKFLIIFMMLNSASCWENTTVSGQANCGDNIIHPGEECDNTNFGLINCTHFGYEGGTIQCNDDCTLNTRTCVGSATTCGDSVLDIGEMCDGEVPSSVGCSDLGYGSGQVQCTASCKFDYSACDGFEEKCGDGIKSGSEECDAGDFGDMTCSNFLYYGGELSCNSDCTVNITNCIASGKCGDGILQDDEECDGSNLNDKNCTTLGYYAGVLMCDATCSMNSSSCEASGWCGDSNIQNDEGEECDGSILGEHTCLTEGFSTGTIACNSSCDLDTSNCY
jgi:hypothetical protein